MSTTGSTPRLSEVARHLVIPSGITTSVFHRLSPRLSALGVRFDRWQQGAATVALGCRADGKFAATVGGVVWSIPRQVGKTFTVGNLLIALCIEMPGLRVVWTSHHGRTTTNTFRAMQGMVKRKQVRPFMPADGGVRQANGEQEIRFANGSIIMFGAREQGFGRGMDAVDVLVFDEAQILGLKALEDMVPATNQARNPHGGLVFFIGTPPRPSDDGEAFRSKRRRALSGKSADVFYVEMAADPDAGLDDREQWAKANVSYRLGRTPVESMLRMRENIPDDDSWRREALGIWDEAPKKDTGPPRPVSMAGWLATAADVETAGDPRFFVAISKSQDAAFIAVAAFAGDVPHLGVADFRPGLGWLAGRVDELAKAHPGAQFGALSAGPVKSWVPTFAELGVEIELLQAPAAAAAYAHLKSLVDGRAFTHSPDRSFVESIEGTAWREVDGGGHVVDWRKSDGDPAPIAAGAGALWLLGSDAPFDVLKSFG